MALVKLSLLGGFDCRSAKGRALTLPTQKARALLAYLALNAGRRHARDKLADLFWGERGEAQARANLRKALSRLREALPRPARACVELDASGAGVSAGAVEVDLVRFEALAAEGTPESLEQALGLHRGSLLEGLGNCGEAFDDWLRAERRRMDETLRQVLRRLLEHYVGTGAIDRAIQVGLRALAVDPLEEGTHRALMRLYLQQDRVGSALDQYRRCREALASELGVEPSADTEAVRREALAALPGGAPREADDLPGRPRTIEAGVVARARLRGQPTGRPSIVVLAFSAADDDERQRRLGEGVAEDVATELGRFPELDVIAPATALAYRHTRVAPERVGRELGTAYVLDGGLRAAGEQVRITVRLLETASGRQLWAERYDCARAEVFDVQDDVVRRIVGTLAGRIERSRLESVRRARPEDWEAYDLWLQGWSALKRPDRAAIRQARALFERAAAKDPTLARAYSGLALTLWTEWACFSWNPWVFMQQEPVDLARKAVELDARDQRAHCILGVAQLYAREYDAARQHLLRALALNPNDADVLAHVSFGMALMGEHDMAVETGRHALRLQPHHPDWYAGLIGIALFAARRHEEAIETMAPAPEAFCSAPAFVAAAHAHLGRARASRPYRETVYRHYRHRLTRGELAEGTSCMGWLLGIDPFKLAADAEHYAEGLRKAGFD
jgi:DNA-binding SARP family transcriptional activator/TolB-like protein